MSPPGIEPGLRPSRGRVQVRHTPRTYRSSRVENPPPGNRTRPCGFEDRRAPDTLAGRGAGDAPECPRQESNLVCDLRRVACDSVTLQGLSCVKQELRWCRRI